jgi:hypothetical protein
MAFFCSLLIAVETRLGKSAALVERGGLGFEVSHPFRKEREKDGARGTQVFRDN